MKTLFRAGCLAGLCLMILGCGKQPAYEGPSRMALGGRVTIDGQPVDGGTISFIPQASAQRVSGGSIVNGAYYIPEEKGANQGSYRVEIHWQKPVGKKFRDPDTGEMKDVMKESIPAKFNTKSTLTATISPKQPSLDFELKSK